MIAEAVGFEGVFSLQDWRRTSMQERTRNEYLIESAFRLQRCKIWTQFTACPYRDDRIIIYGIFAADEKQGEHKEQEGPF